MPLTDKGEIAALNGLCTGRYVSLHTDDPTLGNEVSGNNYARQSYVYTLTGSNPTVAENTDYITFPTATGSWGNVSYVGLWSAASGGDLLAYEELQVAKEISTDDVVRFAPGDLTFSAD